MIGDSIRKAGLGIAMGNAADEIRTTDRVREDGFAEAVE